MMQVTVKNTGSTQWTVIVIALLILALDWRIKGGLHAGLVLALAAYVLVGALFPPFFIPLGIVVLIYLLVTHPEVVALPKKG